jgi:uncharacterized protein YndB with AHSA1/START domain
MNEEVVREVVLEASREEVWEALTDPEHLAAWLAEEAQIELSPGGEARFRLRGGDERTGFGDAVEPPCRLSFWWRSHEDGEDGEPTDDLRRVEFSLVEVPEGTRLRVVETRRALRIDLRGTSLSPHGAVEGPPSPQAHAGTSLSHSLVHA